MCVGIHIEHLYIESSRSVLYRRNDSFVGQQSKMTVPFDQSASHDRKKRIDSFLRRERINMVIEHLLQ